MDASIRKTLISGDKIPINELEPADWLDVINRIMNRIEPLVPHMRLSVSTREHMTVVRQELSATLRAKLYRDAIDVETSGLNIRISILGSVKFEDWDVVYLALDDKGGLRVIQVSKDRHEYISDVRSGDYLEQMLAAAGTYHGGINHLGVSAVTKLLEILEAAERLKVKHAQAMTDARVDVQGIVGVIDWSLP
jgi:hypothetical protein